MNLKAVFSRRRRHKTGEMEGGRLLPGVFCLPYSYPVFHTGYAFRFCLYHSSAGETTGFIEYAQHENEPMNAIISILVFKMPRICCISRTFDDLLKCCYGGNIISLFSHLELMFSKHSSGEILSLEVIFSWPL